MADNHQVSNDSSHDVPRSEDVVEHLFYHYSPLKGIIIDEVLPSGLTNPISNLNQPLKAVASLGSLNLPIETLVMVLLAVPYKDLVVFMAVNSAAFNFVMSIPEFRILNNYGRNFLHLLSKVHLGGCFSIADVFEVFTTPSCSYCASFGGYVFLPGLVRCCQICAESDYRTIPISKSLAQKKISDGGFKLTSQMIDNLPIMTTIPGRYAESSKRRINKSWRQKPIQLLSRPLAEAAMIKGILQADPKAQVPEVFHKPAGYWGYETNMQVSNVFNLPLSHGVVRWNPDISKTRDTSIAGEDIIEKLISMSLIAVYDTSPDAIL